MTRYSKRRYQFFRCDRGFESRHGEGICIWLLASQDAFVLRVDLCGLRDHNRTWISNICSADTLSKDLCMLRWQGISPQLKDHSMQGTRNNIGLFQRPGIIESGGDAASKQITTRTKRHFLLL
jgi:hypothetical protein